MKEVTVGRGEVAVGTGTEKEKTLEIQERRGSEDGHGMVLGVL